jgi:mannose-6-phosphate isomerase
MIGFAMKDHRPWGSYTVLEEKATYKVKRIEVLPGQRLSYQKHEKRAEHWMIVGGRAIVTLNGKEVDLSPRQSIDIPRGAAHRIANPGKDLLTFIEIQQGDYFGEDDIIRLEDDYGRIDDD